MLCSIEYSESGYGSRVKIPRKAVAVIRQGLGQYATGENSGKASASARSFARRAISQNTCPRSAAFAAYSALRTSGAMDIGKPYHNTDCVMSFAAVR